MLFIHSARKSTTTTTTVQMHQEPRAASDMIHSRSWPERVRVRVNSATRAYTVIPTLSVADSTRRVNCDYFVKNSRKCELINVHSQVVAPGESTPDCDFKSANSEQTKGYIYFIIILN